MKKDNQKLLTDILAIVSNDVERLSSDIAAKNRLCTESEARIVCSYGKFMLDVEKWRKPTNNTNSMSYKELLDAAANIPELQIAVQTFRDPDDDDDNKNR